MGLRRRLGRPLRLVCALMACCLAGATLSAAASEQTSTQRSIPGEAAKPQVSPQEIRPQDVIPLEQVAPRAAEVASLLRAGATDVTPDPEVEAIRRSLPAVSAASVEALQTTERLLAERPSLETLQTLEQAWLERQSRTGAWLKLLTDRAAGLQAALDRLDDLHGLWTRTRDSGPMEQAPAPIVAQIDATLASIQAAAPPVRM